MNTETASNLIIPLPYPSFMNKFPFLHGAHGGSRKTRKQKMSRKRKQQKQKSGKTRRMSKKYSRK